MSRIFTLLFLTSVIQAASHSGQGPGALASNDAALIDLERQAQRRASSLPPDHTYPETRQDAVHSQEIVSSYLLKTAQHLWKFRYENLDIARYIHSLDAMMQSLQTGLFHQCCVPMQLCIDKTLCAVLYTQILYPTFDEDAVCKTMEYASVGQLSAVFIAVRAYENGDVKSSKGLLLKKELESYPLSHTQALLWQQVKDGITADVLAGRKSEEQQQWSVVWQTQGSWLRDWCDGAATLNETVILQPNFSSNIPLFLRSVHQQVYAQHHLQKNFLEQYAASWAKACLNKDSQPTMFHQLCCDPDPSKKPFRDAVEYCLSTIDPLEERVAQGKHTPTPDHEKLHKERFDAHCALIKKFNPTKAQVQAFLEKDFPNDVKDFLKTYEATHSPSLFSYVGTHFVARHRFLVAMHEKIIDMHKKIGTQSRICNQALCQEISCFRQYRQMAIDLVLSQSRSPAQYGTLFASQKCLEDILSAQLCQLLRHALHTNSPFVKEIFNLCSREDAYNVLLAMRGSCHAEQLRALFNTTYPTWLDNKPSCAPNLWLLQRLNHVLTTSLS